MKKHWIIGCGVVVVLGLGSAAGLAVALVGGVFALTKPVVESSEQFLAQCGQGKFGDAYASAGGDVRGRLDEAAFTEAAKALGLADFASVSWHNRQIENHSGLAEGTVTTKTGGTKPVTVRLVRENGRWAVVGVRFGGVELISDKATAKVPPAAELQRMAADALTRFNDAVRAKDFTAFHGTVAEDWKKETTPDQIQAAFQAFIDRDIDIGSIRTVQPRFNPPASVNDNGVLVLAGHYPTPDPVRFQLKYVRDGGDWKLLGISVKVGGNDAGER
jgi:hypothetical protein